MGLACSSEQHINIDHVPYKILVLGKSGAGKTQLLYSLKVGNKSLVQPIPTEEFNVEQVKSPCGKWFTLWDLSGSPSFRIRQRQFFMGAEGIIYVIDSTTVERTDDIYRHRVELGGILKELDLTGVPLLVVANKQDLQEAVDVSHIERVLGLSSLTDRKWRIVEACVKDDNSARSVMSKLEELFQFLSKPSTL